MTSPSSPPPEVSGVSTNAEYGFSEVRVETWPDTKSLLRTFPISWLFRGHADARWLPATSLERAAGPELGAFFEEIVTSAFQSQAHNYSRGEQLPRNLLEWWALMQHHGAPTRLLDWTESAYVAAFFALDAAESDCAVWAIDRVWCRNAAAELISREVGEGKRVGVDQIERNFEAIFPSNRLAFAFPVRPDAYNSRLAIQQGRFLCPGSAVAPFMENLLAFGPPEEHASRVVRITLSNQMRANALQDLNYMNINRATLFPGLDGFAQSLRNMIILLRDAEDPVDDQAIVDGFPFRSEGTGAGDVQQGAVAYARSSPPASGGSLRG